MMVVIITSNDLIIIYIRKKRRGAVRPTTSVDNFAFKETAEIWLFPFDLL